MNFDRIIESGCDRVTTTTTGTTTGTTSSTTTTASPSSTTSATTDPGTTSTSTSSTSTTTTPSPAADISLQFVYLETESIIDPAPSSSWFGQLGAGSPSFGLKSFYEVKTSVLEIYWHPTSLPNGSPHYYLSTTLGDEMTDEQILACWPDFSVTLRGDGTYAFGTC